MGWREFIAFHSECADPDLAFSFSIRVPGPRNLNCDIVRNPKSIAGWVRYRFIDPDPVVVRSGDRVFDGTFYLRSMGHASSDQLSWLSIFFSRPGSRGVIEAIFNSGISRIYFSGGGDSALDISVYEKRRAGSHQFDDRLDSQRRTSLKLLADHLSAYAFNTRDEPASEKVSLRRRAWVSIFAIPCISGHRGGVSQRDCRPK